jgi:hypothetical protein
MRPLIVEGPDGAGKTTLLAKLSRDLSRPIFHTGGPPRHREDLLAKLEAMATRPTHFFDRCPHISEPIYAAIADRPAFLSRVALVARLVEMNPVIVYCRRANPADMWRSIDRSAKAHKSPEHLQKVMEDYAEVVKKYDEFFAHPPPELIFFRYDWAVDDYNDLLHKARVCAD